MTDEKQVRQIVREELDEQGRVTRRGVLGLLGGGAVAGALTGSASGAAQTDGNLSLADVTADTYRISGNRYGGPASARSQLESELGSDDAGAKYLGEDNGALFHWTGSSWELMESTSAAVNTDEINNEVHIQSADGADLAAAISKHGSHTRYVVHDVGEPIVFDDTDLIHSWPDYFEVVGAGYPTLKLGDDVNDDIFRSATDKSGDTTTWFKFKGLRLDGNKANNSIFSDDPTGASDADQTIKGSVGIRPVDAEFGLIEDCELFDWTRFGVCVKLSHHITVRNSEGRNCGDDGFTCSNEFFSSQDLSNILFDDLTATNNGDQGIEVEDGARFVTVRDSTMRNNAAEGGSVKSHPAKPNHAAEQPCIAVSWENCEFIDNPAGLQIYGASAGEAVGRHIDGCYFSGHSGQAISIGVGTDNDPIKDITISETTIELTKSNSVGVDVNDAEVDGLDIDVAVDVASGAGALQGVIIQDTTDNLDISAEINGNNSLNEGIVIYGNNGAIHDITISEDTLVQHCNFNGLLIQGDSYVVRNGQVSGTYKNNGQDTSESDDRRAGIKIADIGGMTTPPTDLIVSNVHAYDNQGGSKTQVFSIYHDGGDYNIYEGCNLRRHATGAFNGSLGSNSIKRDNIT